MKKILFPAVAALLTVASTVAFAQSGPWYVVHSDTSQACFAMHRISNGGEEQTIGGPYASQAAALAAVGRTSACSR